MGKGSTKWKLGVFAPKAVCIKILCAIFHISSFFLVSSGLIWILLFSIWIFELLEYFLLIECLLFSQLSSLNVALTTPQTEQLRFYSFVLIKDMSPLVHIYFLHVKFEMSLFSQKFYCTHNDYEILHNGVQIM